MKIGILTFWESKNNYGQILQLYALQCILQRLGHDPFVIKYHRVPVAENRTLMDRLRNVNILDSIKYRFAGNDRNKAALLDERRSFFDFKNENLIFGKSEYFHVEELKQNPPQADGYIVGSDQVWNHTFSSPVNAFLLGFGSDKIKRISYAASFGINEQDSVTQELFKIHLSKFNAISVREKSGTDIVGNIGLNSDWVIDPTMLFNRLEWVDLLKLNTIGENPLDKKNQIFLYTLGNSKIVDRNKFVHYAKNLKGFSLIHAAANDDLSGSSYPTIEQWVYYISTSALVITTSFHGMLFCILNNTNFVILPNTGHAQGMNERITSMLGILNLEDHLMSQFNTGQMNSILNKNIDWNHINEKLDRFRASSMDFLIKNLNS
ncbi:polysaccharide pyruvyl transferase family protein [Robertkochia solimangrovi]|uniref:polysaccharide pyruvyl transferase family protein n=1 Tax=Robertkochia solimangrovi TaxID=2213046 RepID=UPI00117D9DA4|nr:polysaccharide pyruvyl transferase family protein [Robertkochia solimangrovi]TRZ46026.1 hypothetical protein DMZ48_01790 [Robertkochia solimangrovi]